MKKPLKMMLNVLLGLFGLQAGAAVADVTLCMDPIDGGVESSNPDRQDCIDVLAWSWGVGRSIAAGGGGGRQISAPSFNEMNLTRQIDQASPELFEGVALGKAFPKAELFIDQVCPDTCKTDANILKITMDNVLISSLSQGGTDEDVGTESVSLNYSKIEFCYTGRDAQGKATAANCKGYDLEKGQGF